MLMLVSYDVATADRAGCSRLRKIAKACENVGIRVQKSIFECNVNPAQWALLKAKLEAICDPTVDSLRYYNLGANYASRVEHYGAHGAVDVEEPLVL